MTAAKNRTSTARKPRRAKPDTDYETRWEKTMTEVRNLGIRDARHLHHHFPEKYAPMREQVIAESGDPLSFFFPVGVYLDDDRLLAEVDAELEHIFRHDWLASSIDGAEARFL